MNKIILERLRLQHEMNKAYAHLSRTGHSLERITSGYPDDSRLANMGKAFEEMLDHPLVKRFRRVKPRLYLQKTTFFPADEGISFAPNKNILLPKRLLAEHSDAELKVFIAHEIGHILQLNKDARNMLPEDGVKSELLADKIAVLISNEPEAAINVFKKQDAVSFDQQHKDHAKETGYVYPSLEDRISITRETAERIKTAEGKQMVEREITKQIVTDREKIFTKRRLFPWSKKRLAHSYQPINQSSLSRQ